VVAVVGVMTGIVAASIGLVQNDIKRVLAYSTVSQLGYMFAACGVGAFVAGIFHLATHAFFKALLFLGSGSVTHGMGGEQDRRRRGGPKDKIPGPRLTLSVGCPATAGTPPLAGFFSKDEILWSGFKIGGYGRVLWAIGVVSASMTAFYMFRRYHMTFSGTFRGTHEQEHHVHESPSSMLVPLQVLAVGSIVAGFFGIPHVIDFLHVGNAIDGFLEPVFEPAHHALAEVFARPVPGAEVELGLMAASVLVAVSGIGVARYFYPTNPAIPERLAPTFSRLHRVLLNKYYVDEIYNAVFVRGAVLGGGRLLFANDRYVVDGGDGQVRPGIGVNGIAWISRDIVARLSNWWDRWIVDGILANVTADFLDSL